MARLHRRATSGAFGLPAPALSLDFMGSFASAMSRLTFTRASAASYFDAAGAMQIAATDVPRFDTSPVTLAGLGLEIEEPRTNLILGSAAPVTQLVTCTAVPHTLSFYGTGTITLTGVSTAGPLVGTGAFPQRVSLTFTPTVGVLTLTITGTVQYANLEDGPSATSWIQTTVATATRAADLCSTPVSTFALNAAASTLFVEFIPRSTNISATWARLDDASNMNRLALRYAGSADANFVVTSANVSQASITGAGYSTLGTIYRAAGAASLNNVGLAMNGALLGTDLVAVMPTGITTLRLGQTHGATEFLNGYVRRVAYYPTRLANDQIQAMTA